MSILGNTGNTRKYQEILGNTKKYFDIFEVIPIFGNTYIFFSRVLPLDIISEKKINAEKLNLDKSSDFEIFESVIGKKKCKNF
jgi:hypothetical protein